MIIPLSNFIMEQEISQFGDVGFELECEQYSAEFDVASRITEAYSKQFNMACNVYMEAETSEGAHGVWGAIKNFFGTIWKAIVSAFRAVIGWFGSILGKIKEFFKGESVEDTAAQIVQNLENMSPEERSNFSVHVELSKLATKDRNAFIHPDVWTAYIEYLLKIGNTHILPCVNDVLQAMTNYRNALDPNTGEIIDASDAQRFSKTLAQNNAVLAKINKLVEKGPWEVRGGESRDIASSTHFGLSQPAMTKDKNGNTVRATSIVRNPAYHGQEGVDKNKTVNQWEDSYDYDYTYDKYKYGDNGPEADGTEQGKGKLKIDAFKYNGHQNIPLHEMDSRKVIDLDWNQCMAIARTIANSNFDSLDRVVSALQDEVSKLEREVNDLGKITSDVDAFKKSNMSEADWKSRNRDIANAANNVTYSAANLGSEASNVSNAVRDANRRASIDYGAESSPEAKRNRDAKLKALSDIQNKLSNFQKNFNTVVATFKTNVTNTVTNLKKVLNSLRAWSKSQKETATNKRQDKIKATASREKFFKQLKSYGDYTQFDQYDSLGDIPKNSATYRLFEDLWRNEQSKNPNFTGTSAQDIEISRAYSRYRKDLRNRKIQEISDIGDGSTELSDLSDVQKKAIIDNLL